MISPVVINRSLLPKLCEPKCLGLRVIASACPSPAWRPNGVLSTQGEEWLLTPQGPSSPWIP